MTITNFAAGSTAVVVALPAWGFAALEADGFVDRTQMSISSDEAKRALATHENLGITWLQIIESDIRTNHNTTIDSINISWSGGRWQLENPIWAYIQTTLNLVTGHFTADDLTALISEIKTTR